MKTLRCAMPNLKIFRNGTCTDITVWQQCARSRKIAKVLQYITPPYHFKDVFPPFLKHKSLYLVS